MSQLRLLLVAESSLGSWPSRSGSVATRLAIHPRVYSKGAPIATEELTHFCVFYRGQKPFHQQQRHRPDWQWPHQLCVILVRTAACIRLCRWSVPEQLGMLLGPGKSPRCLRLAILNELGLSAMHGLQSRPNIVERYARTEVFLETSQASPRVLLKIFSAKSQIRKHVAFAQGYADQLICTNNFPPCRHKQHATPQSYISPAQGQKGAPAQSCSITA